MFMNSCDQKESGERRAALSNTGNQFPEHNVRIFTIKKTASLKRRVEIAEVLSEWLHWIENCEM